MGCIARPGLVLCAGGRRMLFLVLGRLWILVSSSFRLPVMWREMLLSLQGAHWVDEDMKCRAIAARAVCLGDVGSPVPGTAASAHPGKSWCALSRAVDGDFPRKSSKSCGSEKGHLELPGSANLREMQNYWKVSFLVLGFFFQDVIIL